MARQAAPLVGADQVAARVDRLAVLTAPLVGADQLGVLPDRLVAPVDRLVVRAGGAAADLVVQSDLAGRPTSRVERA